MFKLLPYQEKLVESKSNKILCNWSRGAGATFTLAYLILTKRPEKVLLVDDFNFLSAFAYKINETIEFLQLENIINKHSNNRDKIYIEFNNGQKTEIVSYENRNKDFHRGMRGNLDLLVFQSKWAYERYDGEYTGNKEIILMTENNYDEHLQKEFSEYEIIEVDIHDVISANLIPRSSLAKLQENNNSYYREYAILENPNQSKFDYDDFKNKTLLQLQQEYKDTSKNKDTILTRKNIIDMIITLQRN